MYQELLSLSHASFQDIIRQQIIVNMPVTRFSARKSYCSMDIILVVRELQEYPIPKSMQT